MQFKRQQEEGRAWTGAGLPSISPFKGHFHCESLAWHLDLVKPTTHWAIGSQHFYMIMPEGEGEAKNPRQETETMTKTTTRNVNKILLQAAPSPRSKKEKRTGLQILCF